MDTNMKKMIMLEHYNNPHNKGLENTDGYEKINVNSPTCIDNLDFKIKIDDDIIKDIKFDGEACAISTSSASIMTDLLIGKSLKEAQNIIDNFDKMIDEKEFDENILGEACCYNEISKQPNRIKCATLPYNAVRKILERK